MNNIILIGMMASGKSTVGALLARAVGREFIDTDQVIESSLGQSISEAFQSLGEEDFRKIEAGIIQQITTVFSDGIIALGGGAVLNPESRVLLKKSGTLIYLRSTPQTLKLRLTKKREGRPLLKNISEDEMESFLTKLLQQRSTIYEETPFVFDTDGKTPFEIAAELQSALRLTESFSALSLSSCEQFEG